MLSEEPLNNADSKQEAPVASVAASMIIVGPFLVTVAWTARTILMLGGGSMLSIITSSVFERMLLHRNDTSCQGKGFYTYNSFLSAVNSLARFGMINNVSARA